MLFQSLACSASPPLPLPFPQAQYHHLPELRPFNTLPSSKKIPLNAVDATVATERIGEYEGAFYSGNSVVALGVNGATVAGLFPQSAPNVLGYGLISMTFNGGPSTISADYGDSNTRALDFQDFYFSCLVNTGATLASVPTSCKGHRYGL